MRKTRPSRSQHKSMLRWAVVVWQSDIVWTGGGSFFMKYEFTPNRYALLLVLFYDNSGRLRRFFECGKNTWNTDVNNIIPFSLCPPSGLTTLWWSLLRGNPLRRHCPFNHVPRARRVCVCTIFILICSRRPLSPLFFVGADSSPFVINPKRSVLKTQNSNVPSPTTL